MYRIFVLSIFIAIAMSSISFAQSADVNQNATDVNGNISADVENQINSFPTCDPTNTLCHVFGIDLKIKIDQFTSAIGVTPPETVAEDEIIANYEREKELVQLQNMEQAGNISAAAAQSAYNSLQSDIQNDNQSLNDEVAVIQQANPQEDVGALQNVQTAEQSTDSQINTDQSQITAEQTVSTSSETTSEQPSSATATETMTQTTTEVMPVAGNSPTDNGAAISGEAALVQVKNFTTVGPVVKNRNSRLEVFQAQMQKRMASLNASKVVTKPRAPSNKPATPATKPSTPSANRK